MTNSDLNITYLVTLPTFGGKFPVQHPSKKELESILQNAFGAWGEKIIEGYFVEGSEYYLQNLSFFVVPYVQDKNKRIWIGSLIATDEEIDGFQFTYYDKIGVIQQYQGHGVMSGMIHIAKEVHNGDNKKPQPSILRTTKKKLDLKYGEESDIKMEVNGFYVHGFGFLDKESRIELFEGAKQKFESAALYVVSKPRTVIPVATALKYQ